MKYIFLTQGKVASVDDEDFDRIDQYSWHIVGEDKDIYAARYNENRERIWMHREIMNCNDPQIEVDHKDRDGLNNQKYNLREATHQQNSCNSVKPQTENGSGYRGVSKREGGKYYCAYINFDGKKKHLGTYADPIEAAMAYDEAAMEQHGEFAVLNFERK